MNRETEKYIEDIRGKYDRVSLHAAGSSKKLCLIAEGFAQIYPRFAPTMEWDTAAGQAVVEGSGGGVFRHDDGSALVYNKKDLVNPWFIAYSSYMKEEGVGIPDGS
jgi:3'(2'), 5'-bisphosphate nucleotidase